jgi:hypothetical protein
MFTPAKLMALGKLRNSCAMLRHATEEQEIRKRASVSIEIEESAGQSGPQMMEMPQKI